MVRIRLARRGRKKLALYDIVVADIRAPRDGRFIEKIGGYNPNTNPATIELDEEKALRWLLKGAQPSDTARAILSYKGVMFRKHLEVGVQKGAITVEEATKRYLDWQEKKTAKINEKVNKLSAEQQEQAKARLEAERKINEARAAVLRKRVEEEEAKKAEEDAKKAEEAAAKDAAQKEAAEQIKQENQEVTEGESKE